MKPLFTQTFFKQNRKRLHEASDSDIPIVITANGLLQRSADSPFPFQQDSNFWYLTGITEPDILLVMDAEDEYLVVPGRSSTREAFDGAVNFAELSEISGVSEVISEDEAWPRLEKILVATKKVQTFEPAPAYIEHYGMYTNPARARLLERLRAACSELEITDIRRQMISMRMVKQPEELAAIQLAIDTTIGGIQAVGGGGSLAYYDFEFEIETDLTKQFRTEQASGHAFAPIVAGGKRGVTLHKVDSSGRLQQEDLVVIDVGAEVCHYAADITRTLSVGGKPTERHQAVYAAVLDVQEYALGLLRPGCKLKEYEKAVEEYMGGKLQELGLISEVTHENVRRYYPHATSHFLGLDVHDVGDYDRPLEADMVLTCEPGIYIPEEGIGVRIEDDVLITAGGNRVLSDALPKSLILS